MKTVEAFDVAVIGSGFAGSIMAMVLRRLGCSVLLLERRSHPRFVIGESSTPFANLLLETLAERFDLPVLREFSEFGLWRRHHPDLPVGLKRGFTFYHHRRGQRLDLSDRAGQLLVAASPNDEVADTHWYRPEFDLALVREAQRLGADFRERCAVTGLERADGEWRIETDEQRHRSRFVIDASGGGSSIGDLLGSTKGGFAEMPPTRSVFAHFRDLPRLHPLAPGMPYPADDAAVHHVFDGGWIWMLRFDNGITSAGAAMRRGLFPGPPEASWGALLETLPSVKELFGNAAPTTPFFEMGQISHRRSEIAGPGYALLPSAAAFVDPLLSTGFALSLLGILRLAEAFRNEGLNADLSNYAAVTLEEADAVADLVSALYSKMASFDQFSELTLLYFAALSYTETCWRLGKRERASKFLLANEPGFDAERRRICRAARAGVSVSSETIRLAIQPFDIAGLTRPERNGWHPVDPSDLFAAREKVGASEEELRELFRKMRIELPGLQPCQTGT